MLLALELSDVCVVVLAGQNMFELWPVVSKENVSLDQRLRYCNNVLLLRICWCIISLLCCLKRTYTHTRLTALFPGLPGWASTRKIKPIWILLKQETVSGNGISWAIRKSAPRSRQITTPAPTTEFFYRLDVLPAAQPTASRHWRHCCLKSICGYLYATRCVLIEYCVSCLHMLRFAGTDPYWNNSEKKSW